MVRTGLLWRVKVLPSIYSMEELFLKEETCCGHPCWGENQRVDMNKERNHLTMNLAWDYPKVVEVPYIIAKWCRMGSTMQSDA
jgi:hypothetical protein